MGLGDEFSAVGLEHGAKLVAEDLEESLRIRAEAEARAKKEALYRAIYQKYGVYVVTPDIQSKSIGSGDDAVTFKWRMIDGKRMTLKDRRPVNLVVDGRGFTTLDWSRSNLREMSGAELWALDGAALEGKPGSVTHRLSQVLNFLSPVDTIDVRQQIAKGVPVGKVLVTATATAAVSILAAHFGGKAIGKIFSKGAGPAAKQLADLVIDSPVAENVKRDILRKAFKESAEWMSDEIIEKSIDRAMKTGSREAAELVLRETIDMARRGFSKAVIEKTLQKSLQKKAGAAAAKQFTRALGRGMAESAQGRSGVKVLRSAVRGFTHELKIGGSADRLLGKIDEAGNLVFSVLEKGGLH